MDSAVNEPVPFQIIAMGLANIGYLLFDISLWNQGLFNKSGKPEFELQLFLGGMSLVKRIYPSLDISYLLSALPFCSMSKNPIA
jgi:hypothetical protein